MTSRLSPNLGALDLRGDGRRTVVLRHDLPAGSHHFDWMLASDAAGQAPLITFRLETPPWTIGPRQSTSAKRIADHRPGYLDYQGPVSGDRGSVRRVGQGRIASA